MADKPVTREEKYLAYLTGDYKGEIPKPITRKEKYLYELCLKGIGGEISPEEIENALNEYFEKNPVKPGATTEQAQQIEQNKTDIASLKGDLSNKITKFYASNQGEIHITDSDNGKIQDMMIYGKSSQDGIPTPENPVEIKSVVNPTAKIIGKNLWSGKNTEDYWMGNNETVNNECISSDYIPIKGSQTIYAGFSYDWFAGFNCYDSKKNKILGSEQLINFTQENIEKEYRIVPSNAKTPENTAFIKFMFSKRESKPYVAIVEGKYEPYHEQTVILPYTLNAIPVKSGGNVTIDGQQYIADYVDVERGKFVKMVNQSKLDNTQSIIDKTEWLLAEQQETDLTTEQTQALKELVTYYPATNISVNSEQLDGYTVFNYPISMANGWNYVKHQLNDNRYYIYDMDLQSAEAYVNSEYAVALAELEV